MWRFLCQGWNSTQYLMCSSPWHDLWVAGIDMFDSFRSCAILPAFLGSDPGLSLQNPMNCHMIVPDGSNVRGDQSINKSQVFSIQFFQLLFEITYLHFIEVKVVHIPSRGGARIGKYSSKLCLWISSYSLYYRYNLTNCFRLVLCLHTGHSSFNSSTWTQHSSQHTWPHFADRGLRIGVLKQTGHLPAVVMIGIELVASIGGEMVEAILGAEEGEIATVDGFVEVGVARGNAFEEVLGGSIRTMSSGKWVRRHYWG